MGQIVIDGYMVPFNVLKTQYDLEDVDFFAYIQSKSILGLLDRFRSGQQTEGDCIREENSVKIIRVVDRCIL